MLNTATWVLSSVSRSTDGLVPVGHITLQAVTLLPMAVLSTLGISLACSLRISSSSEETQALLSKSGSSAVGIHSSFDNIEQRSTYLDTPTNNDSDIDEDDEDEKVLKAIQHQRLQASGNWFDYMKEFFVFWPYVWPSRNPRLLCYIAILIINTLALRALNVLQPRQLGIIVDKLTEERRLPWKEILLWAFYGLISSGAIGLGTINELLQQRIDRWSWRQLAIASFNHVMGLSMDFHDEKDSGEIIKAVDQAGALSSLLHLLALEVFPTILDVIVAVVYLSHLVDAYAVLILIGMAISFTTVTVFLTGFVSAKRRESAMRGRDQSRVLFETVSNWSIVAYFNRRFHEKARLTGIVDQAVRADIKRNDLDILRFAAQDLCELIGHLSIAMVAAYRISNGSSPIGSFVTLESFWWQMTVPLYTIGHNYQRISGDLIDAERLLQLFKTDSSIRDDDAAKDIEFHKGKVEFRNAGFTYGKGRVAVENFNFVAQPGETIALVGETGSGKSTTLKLLMRFYDVTSGEILIDDQDIRTVTQDSLRELFGFVPQQTVLFNMSILENVRYGRLDATDEEVFEACKAACMHDKILTFPDGYLTKVGERGVKLSGGELQRIAIARVILKNPQIVLLDEATSAVDSQTEARIQQAFNRLVKGRTAFVIAHRLSTIVNADMILVIDNGNIVERGTHTELVQKGGKYLEFWSRQVAAASGTGDEGTET